MRQDTWYCYNHPEEYPHSVWYTTPKQSKTKCRYFRNLQELRDWCRRHKDAAISAGSWQAFEFQKEARQCFTV